MINITQSGNGNGHGHDPKIEKVYEHLEEDTQTTQDRWVKRSEETGTEIVFSDEVREDLGIEDEDEQS